MSDSTLYDDDILLWSEQQAAAIRKLGAMRRVLPNELDIENIAEEIETVGRSELMAVESHIELIFLHLIGLHVEPDAPAVRHWRSEIFAFHRSVLRHYAPSMRQRIDLADIWAAACKQAMRASDEPEQPVIAGLPQEPPYNLDDLIARDVEPSSLVQRLQKT